MIVSHTHKFIFIKTRKTAGTSVEIALSESCGAKDIITPLWEDDELARQEWSGRSAQNHKGPFNPLIDVRAAGIRRTRHALRRWHKNQKYWNHMPAVVVRARLGRSIWQDYLTFTIERDPIDKTVSHFYWENFWREHHGHPPLSPSEYARQGKLCVNLPLYTDFQGRVMVDRVLRFESLQDDFNAVCREIGMKTPRPLPRTKSKQRKKKATFEELFTPREQAQIRARFSREATVAGYRV